MMDDEEGPVYYREIQKNAYLRRIPDDESSSKLRPLGHKKASSGALWSVLCVHNGRTPYLEQYGSRAAAGAHAPVWRASLRRATLVAPSLRTSDFVLHAAAGCVRMRATDWETMQDWVNTLRETLHELRILPKGENVYCAPPVPAAPRAAARDPMSPLPPTPSVPLDRVPGIEIAPNPRQEPQQPATTVPNEPQSESDVTTTPDVDISNWDNLNQPSTSHDIPGHHVKVHNQDNKENQSKNQPATQDNPESNQTSPSQEPKKSLAKICGQNICLDDSMFKRDSDVLDDDVIDSDEEFFNEIDRISASVENICVGVDHKQIFVVSDSENNSVDSDRPTNITVIQVSNKEPPHTAIPVFGSDTEVFKFDFSQKSERNFVNIVNTETNAQNDYGTIFDEDQQYGHLSLTTTVNLTTPVSLTGAVSLTDAVSLTEAVSLTDKSDGLYERLCLASTSNERASPIGVQYLKNMEKLRKSSLPNLETSESTYEYLYLDGQTQNNNHITVISNSISVSTEDNAPSNSYTQSPISPGINRSDTQCINTQSVNTQSSSRIPINRSISHNNTYINCNMNTVTCEMQRNAIVDPNLSAIRSGVERSHSQNSYDSHRRNLNKQNETKRETKTDKDAHTSKPIWRRGLTELSLLTRLRGLGRRSPAREPEPQDEIPAVTPRTSRPSTGIDSSRRRSNSLSNGEAHIIQPPALQPLRCRQAAALRAEQRRGAALVATVPIRDPPIFADYNKQVWISWWSVGGGRCGGRAGDRLRAVRGAPPRDAAHAKLLLHQGKGHVVDILFHRVPLGKVYVINKLEHGGLGIKLDSECNIVSVETDSPAHRAGIPPLGKWAVTEVNNRPLNLIKGGDEDFQRLSRHGTEVSVIIQPTALVKKLRASLKGNKSLLGLR